MKPFFAIVEQMGHRRLGAEVSEVELFGVKLMHVKVLAEDPFEQYIHPQTLYAVTPCSEEQARRASQYTAPPLVRAELDPPDDDEEEYEPEFRDPDDDEEDEDEDRHLGAPRKGDTP